MPAPQTADNFWSRVARGRSDECWEWTGSRNNAGYGTVGWAGKVWTAHRVAAWLVGMVKHPARPRSSREKTHVLHRCDNRACCNPGHFFLGDYADNLKDCHAKRRRPTYHGEAHTNAKLTLAQAEEVRRRYVPGIVRQVDLAAEYGVSQGVISHVVRGESYKCSP